MHRFTNIETTGNITSAVFLTDDIAEVNLLRRAIISEINTYCIDIVAFDINTSSCHDEIIALRLGQLVIDNSIFVPPDEGDFKTRIDVQGPGRFTTDDIPGLPFKFFTPIEVLKAGQRILCDVTVKQGQGKSHVKWSPVSTVTFIETEIETKTETESETKMGFKITIKNNGMLTGPEILEKGLAKIRDAAHRPPITLFSRPLVPNGLQ